MKLVQKTSIQEVTLVRLKLLWKMAQSIILHKNVWEVAYETLLSRNEVIRKFEANLKFANVNSSEIEKLYNFITNIFKLKNPNELNDINFN